MAKKTTIDSLDEASRQFTARLEHLTSEGLSVAQDRAEALVKAYEAQYKSGFELLKKSTDTLKGLTDGELPAKARTLVDAALETARSSADTWIEFAQDSLGSVRRVINAAINGQQNAA